MKAAFFVISSIVACAVSAIPSAAHAFSGAVAAEQWYVTHELCKMGQTKDGVELAELDWKEACAQRDKMTKDLKAHGWCWDKSEVVWHPCKSNS